MVSILLCSYSKRKKKGKRGRTELSMTDEQGAGADVRQKTA